MIVDHAAHSCALSSNASHMRRALSRFSAVSTSFVGPHATGVAVDWRVLVFTLLVSLITAVVFGVWPAVHASTGTLSKTLTAGGARAGVVPRVQLVPQEAGGHSSSVVSCGAAGLTSRAGGSGSGARYFS